MKNLFVLSIILVSFSGCKTIPIEKQRTLAREFGVWSVMARDYDTTMDIGDHKGLHETNKIMGRHPSDQRILTYFISLGIIHGGIAYALPEEFSKIFQSVYIYDHAKAVINNEKLGLKSKQSSEVYIEWEFEF